MITKSMQQKLQKCTKEFGNITSEDIEKGWLKSKLQKEAREVYSKYSLLSVLSGDSSKVEAALLENFSKAVESKGFEVEDVTVGVPEVDTDTQKSIDAIIRAGQENEKAKLDAETAKRKQTVKRIRKLKQPKQRQKRTKSS